MNPGRTTLLLIILEALVSGLYSSAWAENSARDTEIAGPDIKDPGPDFGFIPDSIGIVEPGRFYVEASAEIDRDEAGDSARVPLLLRVGVRPDWEVRAQTWLVQEADTVAGEMTGAGPVQLGFKHRLSPGDGTPLGPAYGIEVEFLLPLSNGDFDDGKIEPSVFFNADHTLTPEGTLTWNAGFFSPVDEKGEQFLQAFLAAAYAQFVTPNLELYVTGSINYPESSDGSAGASVFGAGGYWYLNRRVALFAGYHAGLNTAATDGKGLFGAAFAF